ncbi:nucleophile aminohydrolase [Peziza echinospora]|nr:nucleophile aminohydrolase [Peziza echinospora]
MAAAAQYIRDFPTHHAAAGAPIEHRFNPYADNGGTILGIAGDDFVVLAGDTRHTQGYNINSRNERKVWQLSKDKKSTLVLATVGFGADALDLVETMKTRVEDYYFHHGKHMTVSAAAQLLMTILYSNRFFPKYAYCILVGIQDGKGRLFSYDPVGSYSKEGESRAAAGAASALIVPFLDNQVEFKNQYVPASQGTEERPVHSLSLDKVTKLVKDAFTSATERHIEVGDGLQIVTLTAEHGVQEEIYPLKRD